MAQKYEVEQVLDERSSQPGSQDKEYLVRWRHYKDATWEPASNLTDCMDLVNLFISAKYDFRLRGKPAWLSVPTGQFKYYVDRPTNPPIVPRITALRFLKEWRGAMLYLAEYADGSLKVLRGKEARQQMTRDEWLGHLEAMFLKQLARTESTR